MKQSIKTVFKVYKILAILFTIGLWIWMPIDDYMFIKQYWPENMWRDLGLWSVFYFAYLLGLSVYYWIFCLTAVLIYHKLIKKTSRIQ